MERFLLGAATAAHQVEGNNIHSDSWAKEYMPYSEYTDKSGMAVDEYHRYKEDIDLLKDAGLNAFRFSIEWARIEPENGKFDQKELDHYHDEIRYLNQNGIEPIVTLLHFTAPVWLIQEGGFESEKTVSYFERYVRKVVNEYKDEIRYVCTINEANMGTQVAAIAERYKRQMMARMNANVEGVAQVGMNFNQIMQNMQRKKEEYIKIFGTDNPESFVSSRTKNGDLIVMKCHEAARRAIREINKDIKVGITLSLHDIQTVGNGEINALKEWNDEFYHYLPYISEDDFFGLQNYSRSLISENGIEPNPKDSKVTQMEYENYPEALEHVIRRVSSELNLPIMITENGIATNDDDERCAFIEKALDGVKNCIKDGINVIGYMHWSLLDNFEWQKGFSMHFGLIAVNLETFERHPKKSLKLLGSHLKDF